MMMAHRLNVTDRVQFTFPSPLEDRTGVIVDILRDCAGLVYYIKLDGKPWRISNRTALRVVDSHRAGLRKLNGVAP
jgi:hypothetical protein